MILRYLIVVLLFSIGCGSLKKEQILVDETQECNYCFIGRYDDGYLCLSKNTEINRKQNYHTIDVQDSSSVLKILKKRKLKDLERFCALDCSLISFPPWLEHCINLKSLHLGDNNITSISSEICNLNQIETINLANNSISSIDNLCLENFSSLEYLVLSNNNLSKISESLYSLPKNVEIYIYNNQIPLKEIEHFIKLRPDIKVNY